MLELNFTPFPALHTSRMLLREVTMEDVDAIFLMRSERDTMKYIGRPLQQLRAEAEELTGRIMNDIRNNTGIGWGISLKENPAELIGTIGYHRIEKEHWRAEIGYMLLQAYWSKGLMSEAIAPVIDYGFREMKLHSIEAKVDPRNDRSIALLQKFGFAKEAHYKENYFFEGEFLDTAVYSRLNA